MKNLQSLNKLMKDQKYNNSSVIVPIFLGDEDGLEYFEMKQLRNSLKAENDDYYQGNLKFLLLLFRFYCIRN